MQTVKQIIHDIADHLPEMATFSDAMYALHVRQKIEEGLSDIETGKIFTQEQVEQRILNKNTL
jgi:predicted transcriptional regulator